MSLLQTRVALFAAPLALGLALLLLRVGLADPKPAAAQPGKPAAGAPKTAAAAAPVSFHKQIRPIFQARCQGCHQSAKASGSYDMSTFEHLVAGGDSHVAAIAPGE